MIVATLFKGGRNREVVWRRHYVRLSTATRRAAEIAMTEAEPFSVVEFASTLTGKQIGVMKIGIGSFKMEWNPEFKDI